MKLLELIAGPETDPKVFARIVKLGEDVLGKGIVVGKDTPNFVGNRIGAHAMMAAIHQMIADGLTPEDVDLIAGEPMGRPKSAAFRTADMVGIDTFVHVADNCDAALTEDEDREVFAVPQYIRDMVGKKLLGDKTKSGFYKKTPEGIATLDPKTGEYRPKAENKELKGALKALKGVEDPRDRLKKLHALPGVAGEFAWKVTTRALAYAARRIPEIADSVWAVDDAMRWGYNWELGPFEIWDALGFGEVTTRLAGAGQKLPAWVDKMKAEGATSFYRTAKDGTTEVWDPAFAKYVARKVDARRLPLARIVRGEPVVKNGGGQARDLGDGILGVTFASKANSVDADVVTLLEESVARAEQDFRGMVIVNEGEHFSVGANLFAIVIAAQQQQWDNLRKVVKTFQAVNQRMKYASVPIVAAPYGITVGGGLELCLGATAVQAAAETYCGLVEVGVGLIPGGAGTLNFLWRALDGIPEGTVVDSYAVVTQVFKNIALAKIATSAEEAKELGFFRKSDGVSFDKARQVHDAKAAAIGLAERGHVRALPRAHVLPGESGIATLRMMIGTLVAGGQASEHDAKIATKLGEVLCGGVDGARGPVSEERMLDLECEAFLSLVGEPKSLERMQFMLMNNKPLRN